LLLLLLLLLSLLLLLLVVVVVVVVVVVAFSSVVVAGAPQTAVFLLALTPLGQPHHHLFSAHSLTRRHLRRLSSPPLSPPLHPSLSPLTETRRLPSSPRRWTGCISASRSRRTLFRYAPIYI
jgi:hypothetical protein